MPKIQCLDPHVADLIAAGEVVERPASVVKELTENAIDAGASTVTVEIQRGGMSYIRVTDNGGGIPAEDVETAFLRHATSKIRNEYDLEAIGTLGFRGEALAAISAVSRVEIMTRTAGSDFGTALLLDGGVKRTREEVGCPEGTTMIVRDLFYNTPARLKFMKRDVAEGAAVFSVVQHAALSHPEVSFRFIREGKQELLTPGDSQLKSAMYAVLGRDIALGFLPCKGSGEELSVEGFVSSPACCRGTRGYQNFFVNGRFVKSRTMTAALEEAYKNTKMVGKFPGCVLHITSRLNAVDVNVHPTKTEVKFTNERKLYEAVYYAACSALNAEHQHPKAELKKPKAAAPAAPVEKAPQNFFRTMTAAQYKAGELHDDNVTVPQRMAAQVRQNRPAAPVKADGKSEPVKTAAPEAPKPAPKPKPAYVVPRRFADMDVELDAIAPKKQEPPKAAPKEKPAPVKQEQIEIPTEKALPVEEKTEITPEPTPKAPKVEKTVEAQPEQETFIPEPEAKAWRIAGEVLDTYIIVEQGESIFLIDKHAAHERMNFDKLKARDYQPMSQILLTPMVINPVPEEGAALLSHTELLMKFGFEVEDFGGALLVRQVPDYLTQGEIEPTLNELAGKLLITGTADPTAARDEVLHTMACKSAIKGGWKSGMSELQVVAEAVMSGQVKYCPHGRPVAIELTRKQLEKQFKRS